jgi:hypothetical protein
MYFSLCGHVMIPLRLLHPLSLNSSIVFICDKGLHPADLLLLLLLAVLIAVVLVLLLLPAIPYFFC